jgi:endonuclease YncB( thermonuclease family)
MTGDYLTEVSESLFAEIDGVLGGEGAGSRSEEQARLMQSWQVGQLILAVEEQRKLNSSETARVMERVSKMLGQKYGRRFGRRNVFYMRKFARWYTEPSENDALCWSHYRALLSVENESRRKALEQRVATEKLTVRALERAVNEVVGPEKVSSIKLERTLAVADRRPFVYKVVQGTGGDLQLDAGFGVCLRVPGNLLREDVTQGDIVIRLGTRERFHKIKGGHENRYAYRAVVLEVVDGDSLKLEVILGEQAHLRMQFRLRGVDAASAGKPHEKKARDFISARIQPGHQVIVHSHCRDSFGPFTTDIFYHPSGTCEDPAEGLHLNREILEAGLAKLAP